MKDWLSYIAVRLASAILGLFPERVALGFGEAIGRVAMRFQPGRRAMAERHMRRVLGPEQDASQAATGVFEAYGRYWAEVLWFSPRNVDRLGARIPVDGVERINAAQAEGRGMILALPHLGNWEVAGSVGIRLGLDLLAVAEALPNRRITDWFVAVRDQFGIEVVLAEKGTRVTRRLLEALSNGAAVALVADRDLTRRGVEVDFFGETTTLPAGPASLAIRAEVPLLPVAIYFDDPIGHRITVAEAVPVPEADDPVAIMTQDLARAFEALIRVEPAQWHLLQPNWPSDRR